jgi:hypothetical protein
MYVQLDVYAMAYKSTEPWAAEWSGNHTVVQRIAAALDFYAIAQGANGGFNCANGCFNFSGNDPLGRNGCSSGVPGLEDEG